MDAFEALGVDAVLCRALAEACPEVRTPTDVQRDAIPVISRLMQGADAQAAPLCDVPARGMAVLKAQTGSGKTLAFLLPILSALLADARNRERQSRDAAGTLAVVVVPTRELAAQTGRLLDSILSRIRGRDHWLVSCALVGSASRSDRTDSDSSYAAAAKQRKHEKERLRRGVHVIVATPGRLLDHLRHTSAWAGRVRASGGVRAVVLDEADRLLDQGFARDVAAICAELSPAVRVLCSATSSQAILGVLGVRLGDSSPANQSARGENTDTSSQSQKTSKTDAGDRTQAQEAATKNLTQGDSSPQSKLVVDMPAGLKHEYVVPPTRLRLASLLGLLGATFAAKGDARVLVFGICCDVVDLLFAVLSRAAGTKSAVKAPAWDALSRQLPSSITVRRLHGGMAQAERASAAAAMAVRPGEAASSTSPSVLVCTDVAARGLDLPAVDLVVQFDAPCDVADYVHRAGRSARAGAPGRSVLFLMPSERDYVSRVAAAMGGARLHKLRWDGLVTSVAASVPDRLLKETEEADIRRATKGAPISSGLGKDSDARKATKGAPIYSTPGKDSDERKTTKGAPAESLMGNKAEPAKPAADPSDEGITDAPLDVRRRLHAWQRALEAMAPLCAQPWAADGASPSLAELGARAFLAFARAYATHPAAEKAIFHVKKLHLGHLAAAFCLGEPPKRLGGKHRAAEGGAHAQKVFHGGRQIIDKRLADELDLNTDGSKKRRT